jgi:hypothetical protein
MKTTKDYSKDLDGIDFLRRLVNNEFLNYTNGITDLDGNKIED